MVDLPALDYQKGRPVLNKQVSTSRFGGRAISFVEWGDPYWTVDMMTPPLRDDQLPAFLAFLSQVDTGMTTITWKPVEKTVPRAYWSNPNASQISSTATVGTITNRMQFTITGVTSGLQLQPGDLISCEKNGYNQLLRIVTGGTASGSSLSVKVDPPLPSYITTGATVRFKSPRMNCRLVPGSVQTDDELLPTYKFQLIEVPK